MSFVLLVRSHQNSRSSTRFAGFGPETTIQFSCQAEFDPSFGDDFEILWEKDGMALNGSENAR